MLKIGSLHILHEDGLRDLVEVVMDASVPGKDEYTLLHKAHLNHDSCALVIGEEFHVMQRTDAGAWGGMWYLEAAGEI